MLKRSKRNRAGFALQSGLLALGLAVLVPSTALCQYHTTETTAIPGQAPPPDGNAAPPANDGSNSGPVRLARIDYVKGDVAWRPDASSDWAQAVSNLPIRQGAQLWVARGARAEIQFDDGSDLRIGNGALLTLKALYSDANGEFTQVVLQSGLATLATRHQYSVYQIDAPIASVVTSGKSCFRVGADNGLEVSTRQGSTTVQDQVGKGTVNQGQYVYLAGPTSTINVRNLPSEDSWDHWNDQRNHYIYDDVPTYHHVPACIALVSGELDTYGDWHQDPQYGWTWAPHVHHPHWRPYSEGHWTWVAPYGYTWVASDNWGWAPYHYGTWVSASYGWAWVPGPATQYWSPAVVSFSNYNGSVCWAPLAPAEVHYPGSLSVGFQIGSWSAFFSIGQAGCYYPAGPTYCAGRPFDNVYVNRYTYVNNVTNITNINNVYNNTTVYRGFVPRNARYAAGATVATVAAFAGHGGYRPATNAATYFTRGQVVGAPRGGQPPVFAVPSVRPTRLAMTPTRSFQTSFRPPATLLHRSVFGSARPGAPAASARPAGRAPGSFAGPNPGVRTATPNTHAPAPNAFAARNMGAAAAARSARAVLGNGAASHPASNSRPGGSFAPAQRRAVSASASHPHTNGSFAASRPSTAPASANRPHSNGGTVPRVVTSSSVPRPHTSSPGAAPRRSFGSQQTNASHPHPSNHSAPVRHTASAPAYRSHPSGNFSRPANSGSFQAHRSAPQHQTAPQHRSVPQQHQSAPPQQRSVPQQRPAPQQRSAPPQRPAPPSRPNNRDDRGR
jgi:hypothetical protein